MTSEASMLAQMMAQHSEEDVLQSLLLFVSLRPGFREHAAVAMQQEPMRRYTGTITNFDAERGFGFIQSQEVLHDFGKDTFVSHQEIGHFAIGDLVTFTVVLNRDGKPQARLLQGAVPGLAAAAPQPPQAVWPPQARRMQPDLMAFGEPPLKAPRIATQPTVPIHQIPPTPPPAVIPPSFDPSFDPNGRFIGTVTSFFPEKKFGFIASEAMHLQFGKDAFLSEMELGPFKVGDIVSFSIALNKQGLPQARNLQPHFGAETGRYNGVISNFSADKGYGFIQCPDVHARYGKDAFLSDQEIGPFSIGSTVSFRVVLNRQGNPQARDLQPVEEGAAATLTSVMEQFGLSGLDMQRLQPGMGTPEMVWPELQGIGTM